MASCNNQLAPLSQPLATTATLGPYLFLAQPQPIQKEPRERKTSKALSEEWKLQESDFGALCLCYLCPK